MATVTLQVIDGLEAGRIYEDLATPVTIGREEDCVIRLNDDRVSRLHARIQEDAGRLILTDVESTNGTRINGHNVRMRVLQPGDQITIGRSTLVFGSLDEVVKQSAEMDHKSSDADPPTISSSADNLERRRSCPELVGGLHPLQAAQLSDMLNHIRAELQYVLEEGQDQKSMIERGPVKVAVPANAWHRLQKLQFDLAVYLKEISDPST